MAIPSKHQFLRAPVGPGQIATGVFIWSTLHLLRDDLKDKGHYGAITAS